jgi:hypothetical protein
MRSRAVIPIRGVMYSNLMEGGCSTLGDVRRRYALPSIAVISTPCPHCANFRIMEDPHLRTERLQLGIDSNREVRASVSDDAYFAGGQPGEGNW